MLPATDAEIEHIKDYMQTEAPDLTVTFLQKVYSENVLNVAHDVWDVHTNVDRWWVITEPTNLYAQAQFPNMDLALTFHIGLCLRIPRSERQKLSALLVEPFAESLRHIREAHDALLQAQEVTDYQAVGVRRREALIAFVAASQQVLPWTSQEPVPKKADVKAWTDNICSVAFSGESHQERRHLFKALVDDAWRFDNWLTHAKSSHWHDAETAVAVTETAVGLCTSAIIRFIRGVPEHCPACGSQRLSPERGYHSDFPEVEWERPTCDKCGWAGDPVPVDPPVLDPEHASPPPPAGECVIPSVPLTHLQRPTKKQP